MIKPTGRYLTEAIIDDVDENDIYLIEYCPICNNFLGEEEINKCYCKQCYTRLITLKHTVIKKHSIPLWNDTINE